MESDTPKLMSLNTAAQWRSDLRMKGKTVVLTNGAFDLLHVGHIHSLSEAAKRGDALIVALNSDASVKALKGASRPIFRQEHRARMLAALEAVDAVVIFEESRLTKEIEALKPDIYVKSGDYNLDTLNDEEGEALEQVGAKIEFVPYLEGFSTTEIIEKIISFTDSADRLR